jgi:GT2 family glycosyltransferase
LVHLEECLSSIYAQGFGDFEVVLVDNASRDASLEFIAARFPRVKVVRAPSNLGFAGGNNFGLPHCAGEYVFFLNNDTRLEPGALQNLAAATLEFPAFRVFACFMLSYRDPAIVDNAGETFYKQGFVSTFSGYPASLFTTPREVNGACAGAALYAREVLDRIGGFDEEFFLVFEDTDLYLRARHGGERILFLPDVRVRHKGSASLGGRFSATTVYYSTRNYFPYIVKNFPLVTFLKFIPGIAFSSLYRLALAVRRGQTGVYLRGLRDGLALLPSMLKKRKEILSRSRISPREFERLFRPGWFRERREIRRGVFELHS